MPIVRADLRQTSFARKMRAYLTAYAENQHQSRFGWKAYRVLTVTTDDQRMRSMQEALRDLKIPNSPGAALFFFGTRSVLIVTIRLATRGSTGAVGPAAWSEPSAPRCCDSRG
jgi:hypothetical protein